MKKKLFIVFSIIVIILSLVFIIAFPGFKDKVAEASLIKEINSFSDITEVSLFSQKERLETYVSSGDYLIIEKSIKNYLLDILDTHIELKKILSDDRITNVISIENIEKDKPEFKETKIYIDTTRESIDELKIKFNNYLSDNVLMQYMNGEELSEDKINLYKKLINEKRDLYEKEEQELELSIETLLELFDKEEKIIDFLIKNQSDYEIKDNSVHFYNDNLMSDYNSLMKEISDLGSKKNQIN